MTKQRFFKLLSAALCCVLIAVMALIGCGGDKNPSETPSNELTATVIGEGETVFSLMVTTDEGQKLYTVQTDKETVGDALLALGIIEGEESQYGLFVKKVDGILADYDTDGTYWAFYIDGNYASTGVDTTKIVAGATYELRKQK